MRKLMVLLIATAMILAVGCKKEQPISSISYEVPVPTCHIIMKRDILCLMLAYEGYITGIDKKSDGSVGIVMKSGTSILYDDKKTKNYQQKISNPDIQDMMEQIYPLSPITKLMPGDFDPGRFRVYALFKEVYGSSRQQIQSNLTNVSSGYGSLQFNRNNKAAESLKSALNEVISAAKKDRSLYSFLYPAGGTFNYRLIAGTNMLSFHSFGTAIDLASNKKDYWKWASREQGQKTLAAYPAEIVRSFEKHNFIWGGKWGHFDIMHYEYRPELILKAKYFSEAPKTGEMWYKGAPHTEHQVQEYIRIIDNALEYRDVD